MIYETVLHPLADGKLLEVSLSWSPLYPGCWLSPCPGEGLKKRYWIEIRDSHHNAETGKSSLGDSEEAGRKRSRFLDWTGGDEANLAGQRRGWPVVASVSWSCSWGRRWTCGLDWWLRWYRICLPIQGTQVPSLGQEDPPEKEMATHSSTLSWRVPWTEGPGRLHSMGSQRVRHNWVTNTLTVNLWKEADLVDPGVSALGSAVDTCEHRAGQLISLDVAFLMQGSPTSRIWCWWSEVELM